MNLGEIWYNFGDFITRDSVGLQLRGSSLLFRLGLFDVINNNNSWCVAFNQSTPVFNAKSQHKGFLCINHHGHTEAKYDNAPERSTLYWSTHSQFASHSLTSGSSISQCRLGPQDLMMSRTSSFRFVSSTRTVYSHSFSSLSNYQKMFRL